MRSVYLIAAGVLLAGCSHPSAPPPASHAHAQATASTRHVKTPWDQLVKDRDKAKAVQKKVDKYAKRQQKAIEKQTQ